MLSFFMDYGLLYLDAFLLPHLMTENVRFPKKRLKFVSLRGRRAAVAIFAIKSGAAAKFLQQPRLLKLLTRTEAD